MCRSPPQPDGRRIDGGNLNHMYGRLVEAMGSAQPVDEVLQPRMINRRERPSPKGPEGRLRRPQPEQGCDEQSCGCGRRDGHERRDIGKGERGPHDGGCGERNRRDEGCGGVFQGILRCDGRSGLSPAVTTALATTLAPSPVPCPRPAVGRHLPSTRRHGNGRRGTTGDSRPSEAEWSEGWTPRCVRSAPGSGRPGPTSRTPRPWCAPPPPAWMTRRRSTAPD